MFELDLSLRFKPDQSTTLMSSTIAASSCSDDNDMEYSNYALEPIDEMASGPTATTADEDAVMTGPLFPCERDDDDDDDDTQSCAAAAAVGCKRSLDDADDADDADDTDDVDDVDDADMDGRHADPLSTPEEVKRMRFIIGDALEGTDARGSGESTSVTVPPIDIPPSFVLPPSLVTTTTTASRDDGVGSSSFFAEPYSKEDPWKHAGMMQEYGGVKAYLKLLRESRIRT
tara:strand:+ start:1898 stop:2587 length:690 start_codon:yes stop_codon:yes gene_type:complete